MATFSLSISTFLAVGLIDLVVGIDQYVTPDEWANYKATYNKTYKSPVFEVRAKSYYAENKQRIRKHNFWYKSGVTTYKLAVNQFTDMPFIVKKAPLPLARSAKSCNEKFPPIVPPAAPSYDPRKMGLQLNIENQGIKCNSGWAYAAAKAIEIFQAFKTGSMNSTSLSAQNLIDCAGGVDACYNQTPQTAFEYLTNHKVNLYFKKDYKNDIDSDQPGMCTLPANGQQLPVVNLSGYSKIKNGHDHSLKAYVSAGMPVVVEFNPASFQFMHYSDGIFQQPITGRGFHFMVVIGYGTENSTKMDYWLLQNSFGTSWGIGGLMKLHRTLNKKITKNAIFPSES